jgi:tRNA pseudouridine55 synthase
MLMDSFSALKMDGKPLYEYARESKPLPRAIPTRTCQVAVELVDFTPASKTPGDGGHEYRWPKEHLSAEEKGVFDRLTEMVHKAQQSSAEGGAEADVADPPQPDLKAEEVSETSPSGIRPACFKLRMTVSSGTYVRSIVNEIGLALGCGAHVVVLTRTRQGEFTLDEPKEKKMVKIKEVGASQESEVELTGSIPWPVWERAIAERERLLAEEEKEKQDLIEQENMEELESRFSEEATLARRRNGPIKEWEQAVLDKFRSVPVPQAGGHSKKPY